VLGLGLAGCGGSAAPTSTAPASPVSSPPAAASTVPKPSPSTAGSAQANATPVRLASSQNVTANAPVWLASQAGLFQKNGLNADLQSVNATLAIKQLVAGQMEGLIAGAPESMTARAAGSPIQIVAVFQTTCDMVMVTPSNLGSIDQVRGKTVAVITKPSVNGVCTVADLRKHGLEAGKDYKLIEAGSAGNPYANVVAVLQGHNADAAALQPDFARKMETGGQFHVLYDLATEPGLLTAASSLTFSQAFIQQHPAEVQKTVDSLLQGESLFKQQRNQADSILQNTFKLTDKTDLDNSYTRLVQLFARDVAPRKELFPDLIESLGQIQDSVKTMDLQSLLEPRFAQDAMNRGLTNF